MNTDRPKYMYKIHAFNTASGTARSACNDTFYETLTDAVEQAKSYCMRSKSDGDVDLVIYKAIKRVRRDYPPIIVEEL